jgi:hypothetical protein
MDTFYISNNFTKYLSGKEIILFDIQLFFHIKVSVLINREKKIRNRERTELVQHFFNRGEQHRLNVATSMISSTAVVGYITHLSSGDFLNITYHRAC